MRSYLLSVRLLSFVLCLLVGLVTNVALAADPALVAQVGTVPVTTYELSREQSRLMPFSVSFHSGISPDKLATVREDALNRLIERAYKVNFALSEKLRLNTQQVEEQISTAKKRFKGEKEFKTALGNEGVKGFRASIERDVFALQAEQVAVEAKVKVTDAEVKGHYDGNKHMYMRPRQFKASHILVKVPPSSNQEEKSALEAKAQDLAKRAKAGEDFYNLAYYNSDDRSKYVGGDLGYFHEGQTVAEFENALKQMKVGETSSPVKTMYGWHIIKLVELNETRQFEFEEVQAKIRQQLEKKQRDRIYNEWISELKGKYSVKKF